jgi:hypothetical protein
MHEELHPKMLSDADLRKGINGKAQQLKVIRAKYPSRSSLGPAHSSPREGDGEGAWSGGGRPSTGASLPPVRQAVAWEHAEAVEAGTSRQE